MERPFFGRKLKNTELKIPVNNFLRRRISTYIKVSADAQSRT
jgi:hypothetical protein